ncbi:hypothetical protein ACIPY5_11625 [Microbacterium sp. NPDC089698]|jgi:hypothetical protein|uniref:hypothetical protein n=1 Tax=unclassified Microbacterium TaxID=2609290 RepID=UPI0028314336|nr:hypothetical protein [Microbacterium sp.]MDR2320964.1 hypothetical protein [Microbacterium sp.]
MTIEVHSDAYEKVCASLTEAAGTLSKNRSALADAVPGTAFGLLGAFVPPVFNALGGAVGAAGSALDGVSRRASSGITAGLAGFHAVDEAAKSDLASLAAEAAS